MPRLFQTQQITSASARWIVVGCTHVSTTTRTLLVLIILGLFAPRVFAGNSKMYCYQKVIEPGAAGGGKVQVAGFTIEVKPITEPQDSDNMVCHASVTSSKGRTVYSIDEWGAGIDPVTGKDVNGDGEPEAVLVSYSGGAHCCWAYHIISLGKTPGLIAEFENRNRASFEDLKGDGRYELVIWDGSFDEGFGLAHAFSVFPRLIVRLRGSEFADVSSDFWPKYRKDVEHARKEVDEKRVQAFQHFDPASGDDDLEYLKTKHKILSTILDYLYGEKTVEAKSLLSDWWPKQSREEVWNEMIQGYCSGLRSQLGIANGPPCTAEHHEHESKKPEVKP